MEGNIIAATTGGTNFVRSEYHKPTSDGPYSFLVQQEPIGAWPDSPLPTDWDTPFQ